MQDDLIARIEAAEGPDRELDGVIATAIGLPDRHYIKNGMIINGFGFGAPLAAYTASLDAARALVPEGWRMWSADFSIAGRFVWMLSGPKQQWIVHEDGSKEGGDDWYQSGVGKTPALALTAAALRARAAMGGGDD